MDKQGNPWLAHEGNWILDRKIIHFSLFPRYLMYGSGLFGHQSVRQAVTTVNAAQQISEAVTSSMHHSLNSLDKEGSKK